MRFATPVEKVHTGTDFHSPDMSLGASAGNLSNSEFENPNGWSDDGDQCQEETRHEDNTTTHH